MKADPRLARLREFAEAARASEWYCPNWYAEEDPEAGGYWSVNARGDGITTPIHGHMAYGADEATYRYLAALEPDVILALLDAIGHPIGHNRP